MMLRRLLRLRVFRARAGAKRSAYVQRAFATPCAVSAYAFARSAARFSFRCRRFYALSVYTYAAVDETCRALRDAAAFFADSRHY